MKGSGKKRRKEEKKKRRKEEKKKRRKEENRSKTPTLVRVGLFSKQTQRQLLRVELNEQISFR